MNKKTTAVLFALLAAMLYALNTPFSKLLLSHVAPTLMAAFLYLGAGIGVGVMYLFHIKRENRSERLTRDDLPYTIGMILLDILAPIFLMIGIKTGSASNASLLGNFEIVATTVIALLIFKESVTGKLWTAIAFITVSSIILTFEGSGSFHFSIGSLFVILATACWGLENNCTRKISDKSTYEIVVLKGVFSGSGSLVISCFLGERFPEFKYIIAAMLLGFAAYGLSIFLYIRAQSGLGAAKTSAYYAVAPFIGSLFSFIFNGEKLTGMYFAALALMLIGTVFVVYDTMVKHHIHGHTHVITHTHNGTTHTHTIIHEHEHDHLAAKSSHRHFHLEYMNSEAHRAEHNKESTR